MNNIDHNYSQSLLFRSQFLIQIVGAFVRFYVCIKTIPFSWLSLSNIMTRRRTRSPDDDRDDNDHCYRRKSSGDRNILSGPIIYHLSILRDCYLINRGLDDYDNIILIIVEQQKYNKFSSVQTFPKIRFGDYNSSYSDPYF